LDEGKIMNRILLGIGIGVAASMSIARIAAAQELPEIVVSGTRVIAKTPAADSHGFPVLDMSVSIAVSYAGLDLASAAGAAELGKRVDDAAKQACKEIANQRPYRQFRTSESECAKEAAEKGMVKVHALVAEAGKKPAQ
jgi:UrcA family protein